MNESILADGCPLMHQDDRLETGPKFDNPSNINVNFSPAYDERMLKSTLIGFIQDSIKLDLAHLKERLGQFYDKISQTSEYSLPLQFLEHSHYIYSSLKQELFKNQEELTKIQERKLQFDPDSFPSEDSYNLLIECFDLASILMCKWDIFDINEYGYRYKGRSLSVKIVNMQRINETCLSSDIVWFSFGINHSPFVNKIDKVLKLYGKVLQSAIEDLIAFFRTCNLAETSLKLRKKILFCKQRSGMCDDLYEILKSLEISYRYFEKHLIEEFLKVV